MALSLLLMIGSVLGASRLVVENSFIDYFRESTEIYQGMKVIDEKLGGTTPLDVLVSIPVDEVAPADQAGGEPTGVFAELEAEFEAEKSQAQYWFTARKMAKVEAVHDYLDALPETGDEAAGVHTFGALSLRHPQQWGCHLGGGLGGRLCRVLAGEESERSQQQSDALHWCVSTKKVAGEPAEGRTQRANAMA